MVHRPNAWGSVIFASGFYASRMERIDSFVV
jgi:hypothetical protein